MLTSFWRHKSATKPNHKITPQDAAVSYHEKPQHLGYYLALILGMDLLVKHILHLTQKVTII